MPLTVCVHAAGTALVAQKVRKVVFQGGWYEPLHPNGHGTFNWDCGGAGQHWSPYARDGCAGAAQHVVCEIARQGSSHTVPSLSQRHSNLPTASSSMLPTSIARFSLCAACAPLPHTSPCVPPHPGDEHASDGTDDLFGHWRRDLPRRWLAAGCGTRLRGGGRCQPVPRGLCAARLGHADPGLTHALTHITHAHRARPTPHCSHLSVHSHLIVAWRALLHACALQAMTWPREGGSRGIPWSW